MRGRIASRRRPRGCRPGRRSRSGRRPRPGRWRHRIPGDGRTYQAGPGSRWAGPGSADIQSKAANYSVQPEQLATGLPKPDRGAMTVQCDARAKASPLRTSPSDPVAGCVAHGGAARRPKAIRRPAWPAAGTAPAMSPIVGGGYTGCGSAPPEGARAGAGRSSCPSRTSAGAARPAQRRLREWLVGRARHAGRAVWREPALAAARAAVGVGASARGVVRAARRRRSLPRRRMLVVSTTAAPRQPACSARGGGAAAGRARGASWR